MSTLASLVIKLEGDIAGLQASMKRAEEALDRVEKKGEGLGGMFKQVGSIAGGFLAGGAISAGVGALTGFLGDSVTEGIKLGESINAVNKIFKDSAPEILAWGKANATSFGLSQQAFNGLAVPLGALLTNSGLPGVADKTIELTKRAADMASVFNVDVSEALAAINSGLKGEADPLERFGVGLSAAKVEALAMAETGKTAAKELTDLDKATARYNLIMKESASVQGDFRDTAGEAANAARIQQAKMEELQASIGTKLIPITLKLTEAKLLLINLISSRVMPIFAALSDVFGENQDSVYSYTGSYQKFLFKVQEVAKWIRDDLIPVFNQVLAVIKDHWPQIQAVIGFAVEYAITRIEGLIQAVKAIIEIVTSVVALITALWHGEWATAWAEMKDIANAAVDLLVGYVRATLGNIPEIVIGLVPQLLQAGLDFGGALYDGVVKALEALPGKMREIGRNAANSFLDSISVAGVSAGDVAHVAGKALKSVGFNAEGTNNWRGGLTWVGEKGPELLNLPAGSQIHSNRDSMAMGGIVVNIDTVNARNEHEAGQAGRDIAYSIGLRRLGAA